MPQPRVFGKLSLAAATPADVFASPAKGASFSIKLVNNNSSGIATIQLSYSQSANTIDVAARMLPQDYQLKPGDFIELTGQVIESGWRVVAQSDITGVNAVAVGWEA